MMIMYVLKNKVNGKYFRQDEQKRQLDAELEEATKFETYSSAKRKAAIEHAKISMLGLGINFEVEKVGDCNA